MWHLFQIKSALMLLYLLAFWNDRKSPHQGYPTIIFPPFKHLQILTCDPAEEGREGHDESPVASTVTDIVICWERSIDWCVDELAVIQTAWHITQTHVRPCIVFIFMLTVMRHLCVVVSLHNPDKHHLAGPLYSSHSSKRSDFPSAASDTTLD